MKKISLILLSLLLVFSLCACAGNTAEELTTEAETQEQAVPETTTLETITGDLYAVINGETKTNQFSCSGGTITPERIAAGFTGWTGISFSLTSVIDETNKTMTLIFKENSAMVTGDMSNANEGFEFSSVDEMKQFIKDSMTETIKKNIGEYEITFDVTQ